MTAHSFHFFQYKTKTPNYNINPYLTTFTSPAIFFIFSTSSRAQYIHITYKIFFPKKRVTSNVESNLYTKKAKHVTNCLQAFIFSSWFSTMTQHKYYAITFPTLYHIKQPFWLTSDIHLIIRFSQKIELIMKSTTHQSAMP